MNLFTLRPLRKLLTPVRYSLSRDNWKDREEASEKVYISQAQKKSLEKLLHKMEDSKYNATEKQLIFKQELTALLKNHNVNNEAFAAQVLNLHRNG